MLLAYLAFYLFCIRSVIRSDFKWVLIYAIVIFPIYALFLSYTYLAFQSPLLSQIIQYSKEILIFTSFGIIVFGRKSLVEQQWQLSRLDILFLLFLGLTVCFFILGTGDATFVNRAIYLKNILLICIFYFLGRSVKISFKDWGKLVKVIFIITLLASVLVTIEKTFGTHFHKYVGYAEYNLDIKGEEPTGLYGLAWTFEAEGGKPRYGSFFAHPLELSSSMLITTAICIIYIVSVSYRENKIKYLIFLASAFICVVFAYSRASFVSFFMMLGFMAVMLRYYKLISYAIGGFVVSCLYIIFLAPDEVFYFAVDTLTFQNSSSLTHLVDWLIAVESILENPQGIGLAMSGNAGGVEKELIVGGENQFLVYGVQMGVLGMLLYIAMLGFGIRNSWRAFKFSKTREEGIISFVAAAVKFGLLLPLFTANAETYLYVCLVSWWLIGNAETRYQARKAELIQGKIELSSAF